MNTIRTLYLHRIQKIIYFVSQSVLTIIEMDSKVSQKDDLRAIREMMEKSSRFLSLSGLSGILAGLFAIAGALVAWLCIPGLGFGFAEGSLGRLSSESGINVTLFLVLDSAGVLSLSLVFAILLSRVKAKKNSADIWSPVTRRMLFDLMVPLIAGGIFSLVFLFRDNTSYIIPAMLVFYGVALLSVSKYTYGDVKYLGLFETATGLTALFFPGLGLIFWLIGFGILHIAYGTIIQLKYQ
jgi:hypothetical protein